MTITANLPLTPETSYQEIKQFFDKFYIEDVTFPSNEIDAVVGFFQRRDFDLESARSLTIMLLNQARNENVNVFELLDTLTLVPAIQLSRVVTQILNAYREKTSLLGYRTSVENNAYELRNVVI
jgi:glutaredoxin 2